MTALTRSPQAAIEAVNGSPKYVGAISATTSVATQALASGGGIYLLQTDADVFIHGATASNGTVKLDSGASETLTAAKGVKLIADKDWIFSSRPEDTHLAAICASGTATLKVFRLE